MAAVACVRHPLAHQCRVERGLCSEPGSAEKTGALSCHRVLALWLRHVIVQGEPQRRARTRRTAARADALLVEVPLRRLRAHELQRTCRIFQRPISLADSPPLFCASWMKRYSTETTEIPGGAKAGDVHHLPRAVLIERTPAATVNEKDDGRRLVRLGLVKVEHLLGMLAIGDIGVRGLRWWGFLRRCCGGNESKEWDEKDGSMTGGFSFLSQASEPGSDA